MRKNFNELFNVSNEMISPKLPIFLNGVSMNPGVFISRGVLFGGVDLFQLVGKDLVVEFKNDAYHLIGVY